MMKRHGLSKSRILAFKQCPKRLWLSVHRPELAEQSASLQVRFHAGNSVGKIAQLAHPKGILIEHVDNLTDALEATAHALRQYADRPLFEAAFQHEGVLVRADLMLPK